MSIPRLRIPTARGAAVFAIAGLATIWLALPAYAVELLVSNTDKNQVLRYDGNTGAFIDEFIPTGSGGLSGPRGLLLGTDGNIYVASYTTDSIKKYDGTTGAYISDFVSTGSGGLNGPDAMIWGPDGNLYVSSNLSDQVIRYQGLGGATPGALMGVFVTAGSGGLAGPRGLAFGPDQWTGSAPGPAQDGYPDLLVCSYNSNKVLWYNGLTGTFITTYGNSQNPLTLILERAWRNNEMAYGNLLVGNESGALGIFSGTFPVTQEPDNFFGNFFAGLSSPRGLSWGPDKNNDGYQDIYVSKYFASTVQIVSNNEQDLGLLFPSTSGGLSRPTYSLFKCGRNTPPLVRKMLNNAGMRGSMHTVTLQGDNLAELTSVQLQRMRAAGTPNNDGTAIVNAASVNMNGDDLEVTFDLTGVEAGWYWIKPVDPCGISGRFPEAVLVYNAELMNTGFETGWRTDREDQNICDNPGNNGDKSRPRHWDFIKDAYENQASIHRDATIWHVCNGTTAVGVTGKHYGSVVCNFSIIGEVGMSQTIAAPFVVNGMSTAPYTLYADCRMASFERISEGFIRLIDGTDHAGTEIARTMIPNTQSIEPDGLARDEAFKVTVPQGHIYNSDPPLLTVQFVLQSQPGDMCPASECGVDLALKGFHFDNVRTRFRQCERTPWADVDDDGDADQVDFAELQRCITSGGVAEACFCFDRDDDDDVDEADIVEFVNCSNGPDMAISGAGCQ